MAGFSGVINSRLEQLMMTCFMLAGWFAPYRMVVQTAYSVPLTVVLAADVVVVSPSKRTWMLYMVGASLSGCRFRTMLNCPPDEVVI